MAYAQEDIEKVREKTDLVEIAAEVTRVKRIGRSVKAICPFHDEKTPSLSLDSARGLYHCFGCGKGGDVFRWVQETQSVDFVGAVELLARRVGVTLQEDPGAQKRRGQREALIAAVRFAVDFYHDRLVNSPDASGARSYLRSRGYGAEVVNEFELGYSPAGWDELAGHLAKAGVPEAAARKADLIREGRNASSIDRFRGRLMFPIYDLRGDPVGFGARLLEGEGPKYLNSSESPIYHKSRLLYGLNWSKSSIVRNDEAVVVEGYTDVIAFHLAGSPIAVATCGTALGKEHLDLLRRFSSRIVLAFDADEAGTRAALRGFEKALPGDLDLRVVTFPAGRDPADLVAEGEAGSMLKSVADSVPLLRFHIENELGGYDLNEAEARSRAVQAAGSLIRLHPDPVVRHEYSVMVSRRTGVALEMVERSAKGSPPRQVRHDPSSPERPLAETQASGRLSGQEKAEQELLRLLLANELGEHEVDPQWFDSEVHLRAYEMSRQIAGATSPGDVPDLGRLIGDDPTPQGQLLRRLAMSDLPRETVVERLIIRLKVGAVERRIIRKRRELESLDSDDQGCSLQFAEVLALEQERRELWEEETRIE